MARLVLVLAPRVAVGFPALCGSLRTLGQASKHDIQRALNVRNLHPQTAPSPRSRWRTWITRVPVRPGPRLQDMDLQGIDQVMIIPTDIPIPTRGCTMPWAPRPSARLL